MLDVTLRVLPPVRKREMPNLLAAATVATSLFRPIPEMEANSANKFFDALAAARPVAINYGGWHRELLAESGAGIALPTAPRAAAEQLAAFLARRRRDGARRRRRAPAGGDAVRPRRAGGRVRERAGARGPDRPR